MVEERVIDPAPLVTVIPVEAVNVASVGSLLVDPIGICPSVAAPSDAIADALRVQSPIYITRAVLDKAGVSLYEE